VSREMTAMMRPLQGMPAGLNLAAAGVLALGAAFVAMSGKAVSAFAAAERDTLKLEQIVRSTGGAAGRSERDIDRLATSITRTTMATEQSVKSAAAQLLTFRTVSGETFDRTLRAAQDLAAVGFGSIESASVQLGKALEDPAQGLSALRRAGITFTETQRGVIQSLTDTGRTAEAQALILAQVEQQVGGAGAAEGSGLSGAFHALGQATGDFLEVVGGGIADLIGLEAGLRGVAVAVDFVTGVLAPSGDTVEGLDAQIEALTSRLDLLRQSAQAAGGSVAIVLGERLATLQRQEVSAAERVARLQEQSDGDPRNRELSRELRDATSEWINLTFQIAEARTEIAEFYREQGESSNASADFNLPRQIAQVETELAALEARRAAAHAESSRLAQQAAAEQARIRAERVEGVTSGLEREIAAIGATKREQDILNAVRRAGVEILSAEGIEIAKLIVLRSEAAAAEDGQRQLATMQEQLAIRQAEVRYGRDSVEAAEARAAAERRAFEAGLDAKNIAGELKTELMRAHDAAAALSRVDIAGNVRDAANAAGALASNLGAAMTRLSGLQRDIARQRAEVEAQIRFANDPARLAGEMAVIRERAEPANASFGAVVPGAAGAFSQQAANEAAIRARAEEIGREQAELEKRRQLLAEMNRPASGGGGGGAAVASQFEAMQSRAQGALMDLGLAIAAVNEKTRAGLLTTAEGVDAVAAAKSRAANEIAELIPQIEAAAEAIGPGGAAAVEQWRQALAGLVPEIRRVGDIGREVAASFADEFSTSFVDFVSGSKDAGDAFSDFANNVLREISRMMAQRFANAFLAPLIDSIVGSFADGGVPGVKRYAAGGLPALGEFANTVVSRPTRFAMGGGVGEMGEAGPEAILPTARVGGGLGIRAIGAGGAQVVPLIRVGGKLGVQLPNMQRFADGGVPSAAGIRLPSASLLGDAKDEQKRGVGGDVKVIVNNNAAPQAMATVEERQQGGERIIEVMIEQVEAGIASNAARGVGPMAGMLSGVYGLRRAPR
jgi:hypothetical protein